MATSTGLPDLTEELLIPSHGIVGYLNVQRACRFGRGIDRLSMECVVRSTAMPYYLNVLTVIETPVYSRKAEGLLSDDEREEFAAFISLNPNLGSVVRGSGGVRKVRWARAGSGKSGGVRVIYYNQLTHAKDLVAHALCQKRTRDDSGT